MLLTEEEAIEKWCPYARYIGWDTFRDGEKVASANRDINGDPLSACLCLASKCMQWRFVPSGRGHCGLASKPG